MEASRGRREGGGAAVSKKPSAAGAKSAYDDVFGGPPRFAGAAPFAGGARMDDYAEIFGGMAASCSIPFLDLPPAGDGFGELPAGGKVPGFDYSEVFGGFDFGEFASTYEELLAEQRREGAVGSSNGRAPMESNLRQQASEACESPFKHRNGDPVLCAEDDQSSNSNHPDGGSKQFNMSYNKLDSGLKEYAIDGITQITELHSSPRFSYTENKPLETEKSDLPHSVPHEAINDNKLQEKKIQTCSDDGSRGSRDGTTTEWEQTDSQYPLPEIDHVNVKHYSRPSSSHSASSGNMSPSEIMYVSVSDINLQTQPSRVPPPSRPPPKMFNKQVHPIVKMNINSKIDLREGSSRKPISNHEKLSSEFISERPVVQEAGKESSPYSLDVEVDASSAAAAAMKEAMELAQARLRSAKELMERKRDNFHNRKKMNHSVNIKPKDRMVDQASAGRENVNPILMQKAMVNEPKQNGMDLREENKVHNTVTSHDSRTIGDVSLTVEDEQMVSQNDLKSAKVCSGVEEESEKWKVNKEYYELTSNEKKCNKVTEISEQEAYVIKIKETGKSVEQNEIKHIERSAVPEFENNTQLFSDSEENRKAENASSLRTDDISYAEERTRVTSNVVPDALLHENVINLEETCASHGEQNKIPEEAQGVHAEAEDVPCVRESDHGFLKIGEKVGESISQLNHDSVHVEGKSKVAKEFLGTGECSYEFKGIYDSEDEKSKSETFREEHIVDDVSFIPHEVEKTLDATQRTPALDEKEIKVLDDSVKPEGGEDSEATYSFNDPKKAEREEQVKSNQVENENRMEETDMTLEQKDNKTMQQESSMLEEKDCRFEMDQEPDYLEEVYKKLKAAQEAAMNEEQEELTQATRPTWQEENNAYGAQNECQQSDKMQQSTQAPSTLGNSKESNVLQDNNESTVDKDTREIHLKYDVFDKSPNLNTPHEVAEDEDTRERDLKSNVFDKSPNLNTPHEVFSSPPHTDLNTQQTNLLGRRSNIVGSTQDVLEKRNITSEKCMQMNNVEDSAQLQTEMEQADEQTRKLEEKEREREREKDRIAFERATREAHERALADARERAERIAVERVTAEARQRALKEACEKAELEKAAKEARLRAERAAVERATAEARERAAERARAEMAASDSKDRAERFNNTSKDRSGSHITHFQRTGSTINSQGYSGGGESALRCKARLERHQRTAERAAKALAEKNRRDILAQREQAERDRLAEYLDAEVKRWSTGKEGNLRALLSTLQYILGTDNGWQPIPLQEVVTAAAVKKAYRKATLFVHPDKLQQRGATIQQKYICEKVFDLLKEAWNRFNSEER